MKGAAFHRPRTTVARALCSLTCAACLAVPAGGEAPRWGDLLVLDRGWPGDTLTGAILLTGFGDTGVRPAVYFDAFGELDGVSWGPDKAIYTGDGSRIWNIDPYRPPTERPRVIRNPDFKHVIDLARGPSGEIYVLDRDSDPLEEGYHGALLRLDPTSRAVTLLATDPLFVAPSAVAVGPDGSLFVMDPWGRMSPGVPGTGAIYRINPQLHSAEPILSLGFAALPAAIALRDAGTLLLADAQASIPGYTQAGGAVFSISLESRTVTDTLAIAAFREPIDLLLLSPDELVVLDRQAEPWGSEGGHGALLRIDLESGAVLDSLGHPQFTELAALALYDGPDLDASSFHLAGLNGTRTYPGASLSFEAALVNRGAEIGGGLELAVDFDPLECLFATAAAEAGEVSLEPGTGRFLWKGELNGAESLAVTVDLRVPADLASGSFALPVSLTGALVQRTESLVVVVDAPAAPPEILFLDAGTAAPSPRIFTLGVGNYQPVEWQANRQRLPRMTDLTFGPDGTVYVLDVAPARPKVVAVDPVDRSLRTLYEGAPLTIPTAICLAHDGALLITDAKAYYPYFMPPVVYRLDPQSGELTQFFTTSDSTVMRDPVDICPDRGGHYLVADFVSNPSSGRWGRLVELDREGRHVRRYASAGLMDDPFSVLVDDDGSIFVTDTASSRPSVIRLVRFPGGVFSFNRVADGLQDTLLRAPVGIERLASGDMVVCDWSSNPYYALHGGLLRLERAGGQEWDLAIQSFHYQLGRPRRAAAWRSPEPVLLSLKIQDPSGEPLRPGDTLRVETVVENFTPMPALGAGGRIEYPSLLLEPVTQSVSGGHVRDDGRGSLYWSADLAFLAPETLRAVFRVDSMAPSGEVVEIVMRMSGVPNPPSLAVTDTIVGPFLPNQVVVLDAAADPFGTGHHGALFQYNEEDHVLVPHRSHAGLVQPIDILMLDEHRLLLLESEADTLEFGPDTGALWLWDLESDDLQLLAGGAPFVSPQRVHVLPDGDYLVLDSGAICGVGRGALFRVPADGGEVETFTCPPCFRQPVDMVTDGAGRLWVADLRANPLNYSVLNTGAFFAVDLQTRAVVDTVADPTLGDPQGLFWLDDGRLLFTDPLWQSEGGGGIRVINPETGRIDLFAVSSALATPTRVLRRPPNELLVIDSTSTAGGGGSTGALHRFDLITGERLGSLGHPECVRLQALTRVPSPEVRIRSWAERDDAGGWWRDGGDTLHCEFTAENPTALREREARLTIDLSSNLQLIAGSLSASRGAAEASSGGIVWEGELAGGDSVQLVYDAVIARRLPGDTPWIEQDAMLLRSSVEADSAGLRHYISNVTSEGDVLVADGLANPWNDPSARGAVFRVEGLTRDAVAVFLSEDLRQPADVALVSGSQTEVLVLDARADPEGRGIAGCLLSASTRTGRMQVVFQDSTLVEPVALAVLDSTHCFILDRGADPLDLLPGDGPGPGAIYQVDLEAGTGSVIASDSRFVAPTDLVLDPLKGRLYVIDRGSGGGTGRTGGVFVVDPGQGSVQPFWQGAPFLSPRAGTLDSDGTLLVLDRLMVGGSIYRVTGESAPTTYAGCFTASDPQSMLMDGAGRVLLSDATANPGGFPAPTGSILRFPGEASCQLYRGGPPFVRPHGIDARFEITAVALAVRLLETSGGVQVCWSPVDAYGPADFYVYRRMPEIPAGGFDLLNPDDPIQGTGEACFVDANVDPGALYEYQLLALLPDGSSHAFPRVSIRVSGTPMVFFLAPPVPNPLHPGRGGLLTIRFGIPGAVASARLSILDVTGRLVRTLFEGPCQPGLHAIAWDGSDQNGAPAGSGVYFARLDAARWRGVRRLMLIR
ncbi:MAG: FlgD immunoglobulin-like domain containing protein [Candidatus Eisenbacteria bacterium]